VGFPIFASREYLQLLAMRIFLSVSFFVLSLFALADDDYSITIYTIPAKTQIDFSSPRSMAWTSLGNTLTMHFSQRKNAMGHVFVELNGPDYRAFTGSTKQRLFSSGSREIKEGYGLGILFHGIEGKLEWNEVVIQDLPSHYHNGDIAFLKIKISAENFERLRYYLDEYQRRGYDSIYNGLNRPREGLGAGCTAFGISFLEVAGVLQPDWEEAWFVDVRVPMNLIGGPLTGNFVPLEDLFFAKQWASPDEPHHVFRIADPYLMFEWIHFQWNLLMTEDSDESGDKMFDLDVEVSPVLRQKAKGLVFDFSSIPVPDEPVFLVPAEQPERRIMLAQ
jgi:hypothetical protein